MCSPSYLIRCCSKNRTYHCKIILLDEQEIFQEIRPTTYGEEVLKTVFRHLNLIETSYFGLRYIDNENQTHWLDVDKRVKSQLRGKRSFTLYFGIKFYAADPCKLLEEITRYQFFLQLRQDILQGRLPVPFELAAELGAYLVQSELGDYDPRRHNPGYVSEFRFVSNQTYELEKRIEEIHKDLMGQQPSVAELNYLEKVKWLEMYGVDLHPVVGEDNTEYFLGLMPTGVIVLRNKNKVANYYWPRITKIYHKGKYFMLRVTDKNNEENTYGFETPSKSACKHLYKCSVEHNSFFKLANLSTNTPDLIGSSFNGRRDKTSRDRMRNTQFVRTPSRRYQRREMEMPRETFMEQENLIQKETQNIGERKTFSIIQLPHNQQNKRSESPRSIRSAPPTRGLYTTPSPRSLRSAGNIRSSLSRRSASLESRSSTDSKPCKRHYNRRKGSDNESEVSKCSVKSRRRRNRSRRASGSERDSRRHRNSSKQRYELVDSSELWKEVQRKQAERVVQKAKVVASRKIQSELKYNEEKDKENGFHTRSRRHRKHRSRSKSPTDSKRRLPDELKQHLQFTLIDTDGMTESQLREIPYKVVETDAAKAIRVKLSPTNKRISVQARRHRSSMNEMGILTKGDSPPPPYCEKPNELEPN
ncbi:band 4.1-like protein 4A isoform X2 [Halyomorpha halys]|nr:band 4.1-like protein 4A isoform X2 [Halyomorpha halys]